MAWADHIIFISAVLVLVSIMAGMFSSRIGALLLLTFLAVGMMFGRMAPAAASLTI